MATKQKPGCMYSLQDQFKDSFMDVYQTFLPSDFRLETGTMFRLPLRTEQMAAKSEISKTVVRPQDIDEFMKVFAEDPDGLILFLKHIKKIECHRIGPDDKLHTVYLIEKHLPEEDSIKKANFKDEVQRSLAPCQVIYNLQISSSNSAGKRKSQWAIAEHVGSPNPNTVQINEESDVSQIPQAAVAACVRVDPIKGDLKFNGRVFCSLPLPVVTGLPVHINANFEVDSSRRDLWKEDAMSLKTEWNESLKMDIISPLYADLLKHIQMTIKTGAHLSLSMLESELDSSFLSFLPFVSEHVNQEWHTMIKHVYRSIHEKNLSVIPVLDSSHQKLNLTSLTKYAVKWSNVHKQNPMDSPHFSGDFTASLFEILKNIGMRVVPPFQKTEKIYNSFQAAGVEVRMLCPNTVREYLKEKPLNDTSKTQATLPLPVNQTLIKNRRQCSSLLQFCIGGVDESNIDSINGLPLLLTQDQMLRKFDNDSPRQYSKFWKLFKGQTAAFADIDYEVLQILQTGGYIQKLTIPVASEYLIPVLKKLQNEGKPPAWVKELWVFFAEQIMLESFKDRQANNIFSEIKKSFADSPIVPVIRPSQNNKPFLKKMKDLSSVIRNPDENISRILIKLGFMTIDNSFFSLVKEVLRTHLESELLKSDDSNAVLENLFQIPHSKFRMLSSNELDILQNYFQTGIKASQNSEEYQRMFKSLPLFQTVKGERQSIAEQSNIFILNAKCTETFPDLFNIHINGHVFLKYNLTNEQLSKNMNIDILTDLDFYVRFLLPSLHTFTETQVIESVQLLLNLKHHDKYKTCIDQIVAKLASVRFIRDIHGSLQLPSYFFDDDEPLYKIMLPQEKFVPSDFWKQFDSESDVRGLVRNLGMKHTVSDVEIIKFARTIESETHGKTSIDELRKKSSALFKKAVEYHVTNKKSNVLNNIATIKFIFPLPIQEELTNYHQPLAGKRDMVAIKGSLMEKQYDQQYLIWTSMPILPTSSFYGNYLKNLVQVGAFDQPPCDLVAQNLKNICQSECQNDHLKKIRKKVFCQSYAYLQSEQAKTFSGSVLQDLPVVLVENDAVLVQASRAVLCLEDCNEFRPYLYQISPHYALYAEFFKMIGVEQRPTIRQYCTVLKDIYKDSKSKQTLNPNQQLTLKRAMQHLFQLLKAQKNDPEQVNFEVSLYLPSTDGKLHKSDDLYFNDTVFQTKRLVDSLNGKVNLLMNLENCYLGEGVFEHQKLLLLLPKDSRPRMLSHVTCEKLVSCNMKLCEYRENCEFSGWFERHLNSIPFLHGLTSLIREQSKGTVSPDDAFKQCRNIFGKLQIICCETLETKVFLGQESLDKTISETQVHVKKESQGCSFYLKHSDNMDFKVIQEVVIRLTKEINSLLQNILCSDFLLALGQLLSCDSQDEVEKTLEKYAIHNTAGKQGAYNPPEPGSQIPEEWYDALDMRFMNNFEIGDYVGFKKTLESDHFYHAVVVERLDAASETSQYCCKYKIQIAKEEFTEVSSLDLYQFKREKMFAPEESFCGEIELANVPEPSAKEDFPSTFEEIKREIDKCLNEVWTMSKEEQHKAIKRLYLRWHPDKNPGQEQLANEAFKYLLNRLKGNGHDQSSTRNFRGENGTGPFRSWNFENFYPQWNSEASYHRHGRKQFYRNTRRSHFWAFYQEMPRPNKEEAKRWYRQAQCDCDAAHYDSEAGRTEWCLFKIHQAVEKALIAAEYRRCGKHSPNCSISGLAQKVSCYSPELSTLPGIVSRLKGLGVDSKATQYPNYHPSPKIPNDAFQPENEKEALNMALKLLQKVDSYLIK